MNIIEIALSYAGIKEIVGKEDNPIIIEWFNELGFNGKKLKDETSWCSLFINICALRCGLEITGKLNARSWLDVGEIIEDGCQQIGDIVIFSRPPEDWMGHVGIYCNERAGWISVLGGNQNNEVKISKYPKSRLLGYRRLKKAEKNNF